MDKLTVEDLDLKGKRVLMRVDFNVPLEEGRVANDKRIRAALPTIKYITNASGKLILKAARNTGGRLLKLIGKQRNAAPVRSAPEFRGVLQF